MVLSFEPLLAARILAFLPLPRSWGRPGYWLHVGALQDGLGPQQQGAFVVVSQGKLALMPGQHGPHIDGRGSLA